MLGNSHRELDAAGELAQLDVAAFGELTQPDTGSGGRQRPSRDDDDRDPVTGRPAARSPGRPPVPRFPNQDACD